VNTVPHSPTYAERVTGCLLGGAIGDALGNPVEFATWSHIAATYGAAGIQQIRPPGHITDDTQMTLFGAEAVTRVMTLGLDRVTEVAAGYFRWLDTQLRPAKPVTKLDYRQGWLREERWLYASRAPGNACMSGLHTLARTGLPGPQRFSEPGPINPNSKGCGTVMRSAPFGLAGSYVLAGDASLLTHGHPTATWSAIALAQMIHDLTMGRTLIEAIDATRDHLAQEDSSQEVTTALDQAVNLAQAGAPDPATVETLGGGWTAEEALAIAVYAVLATNSQDGPADHTRAALITAVNHSGDSDSTGAITGNLIGAAYGTAGLPADLTAAVEHHDVITRVAQELAAAYSPAPPTT
jgi:ADP-ribosylglycohydrolase